MTHPALLSRRAIIQMKQAGKTKEWVVAQMSVDPENPKVYERFLNMVDGVYDSENKSSEECK